MNNGRAEPLAEVTDADNHARSDPPSVLRAVAAVELASLALALAVGWGFDVHWWTRLQLLPRAWVGLGVGMLTPIVSFGATLVLRRVGFASAGAYVDRWLVPAISTFTFLDVVAVAVSSGIAEEALFRGALQPLLGIWGTSILFGLLHTGMRDLVEMGIWAALASLVMGALYAWSGTLWCPILCHATHNLLMMLYLRGPYRRRN